MERSPGKKGGKMDSGRGSPIQQRLYIRNRSRIRPNRASTQTPSGGRSPGRPGDSSCGYDSCSYRREIDGFRGNWGDRGVICGFWVRARSRWREWGGSAKKGLIRGFLWGGAGERLPGQAGVAAVHAHGMPRPRAPPGAAAHRAIDGRGPDPDRFIRRVLAVGLYREAGVARQGGRGRRGPGRVGDDPHPG